MLIVADENMPLLDECFGRFGAIKRLPGRNLSKADLENASALLVRSVTKVDKTLLEGTNVKFVGTATIGTDHLDKEWLDQQGIHHVSSPGCNADSVADWVVACLAHWSLRMGKDLSKLKAGIVGHGNVGQRVEKRLQSLGFETLVSDPPKATLNLGFEDTPLSTLQECDFICLHAPLTHQGKHPTAGMINNDFLSKLKDEALILSAGRGPVLDVEAIRKHTHRLSFFLDVWDPEPNVPQDLLKIVDLATPHIAGYSLQSKWRGTEMLYQEFSKFIGEHPSVISPPMDPPSIKLGSKIKDWKEVILEHYDPQIDSQSMKETMLENPNAGPAFDLLRKDYPLRHEFNFPKYLPGNLPQKSISILQQLGFQFSHD